MGLAVCTLRERWACLEIEFLCNNYIQAAYKRRLLSEEIMAYSIAFKKGLHYNGRVVALCLAAMIILAGISLLDKCCDMDRGKVGANHFLSPWDTSVAPPPYLPPSRIASAAQSEPVAYTAQSRARHSLRDYR